MKKKIDPELKKQLESKLERSAAGHIDDDGDEMVETVIVMKSGKSKKDDDMEKLFEAMIARLEKSEKQKPDDYNLFPIMRRAVIRGKKSYISKLIEQPEIVSAMANKHSKTKHD